MTALILRSDHPCAGWRSWPTLARPMGAVSFSLLTTDAAALDRPLQETEREYLTEFRLAILAQQQARGRVSAAFLPLSTSKR